jgi:hypothetical protein
VVKGIVVKLLFLILGLVSFNAWSIDPIMYLNNFDSKIYSLKSKGVKEFVVDIESSKLTKQMNDQMIFGVVKQVTFRTYWTANPERIAIEVLGLPEGFREIKEELKLSIFSVIEFLLPITTIQRFAGYKFHPGATPKEIVAQDATGIANIQSFVLKFDDQDRMIEVVGKKTIGSLVTTPKYEKDAFASGKWVLKSTSTTSSENGQSLIVKKELNYGSSEGIGVLTRVEINTEQVGEGLNGKSLNSEDSIDFKNYKINNGEALKYFLSDTPVKSGP